MSTTLFWGRFKSKRPTLSSHPSPRFPKRRIPGAKPPPVGNAVRSALFRRLDFIGLVSIALQALLSSEVSSRADALDNWTPVLSNPNLIYGGVAYGNGQYLVVGSYGGSDWGNIQYSPDGVNWSVQSPPPVSPTSILDLYDVTFANGIFVAVGWDYYNGTNIYRSTDGINWTHYQTAIANVFRVIYGGGLFVAVGDGVKLQSQSYTNRNIYTSPDGIAWTARNCGAPAAEAQPIWDVAYGAGRFVAVDRGNHFYSSTTGLSWTRTTATNSGWINFCNGHFIAAAGPGTNLLSNDGVNWAAVGTGITNSFNRIVYEAGTYVAAADYFFLLTSTDATNWTQRAIQFRGYLNGITYANGRFLAVGNAAAYFSDPVVDVKISPGLPPTLSVSGLVGRSYRIERLDDLRSSNWTTAASFVLTNSPSTWSDSQGNASARLYRAVLLP